MTSHIITETPKVTDTISFPQWLHNHFYVSEWSKNFEQTFSLYLHNSFKDSAEQYFFSDEKVSHHFYLFIHKLLIIPFVHINNDILTY